ncbi:MAG: methyltransferase [Bacillota bacterium]|nr:methyltransferase [Bacillota bacterium]
MDLFPLKKNPRKMMMNPNEKLEPLGSGIEVIVSPTHKFNTDTILLANFAAPKPSENAIELGSGCGTIPLLWFRDNPTVQTIAVEIQEDAVDQLKRSVKHNLAEKSIAVLHEDLRNLNNLLPAGAFTLVVCNPPYKAANSGIVNPSESKKTARHEDSCTLDDVISCASRLLQFGGRFCMCLRTERLLEAISMMRSFDLEPKRLRFVQQRIAKEPKLFLIEGRRGGKKGGLVMLPTLMIEDENGGFSEEMMSIYGIYKDDRL